MYEIPSTNAICPLIGEVGKAMVYLLYVKLYRYMYLTQFLEYYKLLQ